MAETKQLTHTAAEIDAGIAAANAAAPQSTTYTKPEVDTALSAKVDKVTGKGLSTEDFTTAEQTKLAGIASGAEVNVQSDWNQTDSSADDFIKNKPTLGTAAAKAVDSAPTASSTNLVESGGVAAALAGKQATLTTAQQAAVDSGITSAKVAQYDKDSAATAELVNGGAKNLLKLDFSAISGQVTGTMTADGNGIIINGERTQDSSTVLIFDILTDKASSLETRYTLPVGKYVVNATGSNYVKTQVYCHDGTTLYSLSNSIDDSEFEYTSELKQQYPYIDVRIWIAGSHVYNNVIIYPMLCTKAAWDISHAYVPYCPSMSELYAMIQAIQA